MKRKIEFRAIDEFSDYFIYAPAFFIDSDNNQGYLAWGISNHHCVKKETVGQFIGLFDKNKRPIYDGDIVRLNGWGFNGQDDGFTKIIWDADLIGWNFEKSNYAEDRYDFRKAINNCEVVGNIYSNPELLP